jgi:hypothetical protein
MKKWIALLVIFQLIFSHIAFSQTEDDIIQKTQNDILLVAGAGAGGAVLGLSTLSFYERPSKNLSNIWTGAAIGIIAGVVFVAYTSAQKGSEELVTLNSSTDFSTSERGIWHLSAQPVLTSQSVSFSTQIWQTTF